MLRIYLSMVNSDEDKNLVEFLYKEYGSFMYNVAYSILHNVADSEDAVHEAFMKIINNKLSKFKQYSCYLLIMVRGIAINMVNKRNCYDELDDNYSQQASAESVALANIEYEDIVENIKQLSPVIRDIATLHYVHEWNAQEIADFLDIKRNNVYIAISRAKKELLKKRNRSDE